LRRVTPPSVRPLDAAGTGVILALCLCWGFNQVAVKLAIAEIPPLTQAAIRSVGAAAIVALWARWRGVSLTVADGTLKPGLAVGALFGTEFMLLYQGLAWTTASRAVLFLYTAPFFVVLGARRVLPGDYFGRTQWAGLVLSFAGIAVAFGLPTPAADPRQALGDVMMLAAAAVWGATTLVVKASALDRTAHEKTLLYQLVVSAPLLALGALVAGERVTQAPSPVPLASLVYQTVLVSGISYLAWFALIQRYSASRLSAFTFVTPLFGVAVGHVVLGEPLTPPFAAAAAMVAGGLVLVNRPTSSGDETRPGNRRKGAPGQR
jgi:drug/metabolite transporter (DMT)-like permease